jgi:hypothetical protein
MLKRDRRALGAPALGLLIGCVLSGSAAAAASAMPSPSPSPSPSPPPSPAAVVNRYLAALKHHSGAGVCATCSAHLRAFKIARDAPISGPRTCAATVNAHFHDYDSAHRWASARIVGVVGTLIDNARRIALVRTTLAHRYICVGPGTVEQPCHPDIERPPEYVWLIRPAAAGRSSARPRLPRDRDRVRLR